MNEVINARIPKEYLAKIDLLIARKQFKSRSNALRKMVDEYFKKHPEILLTDELRGILAKAPSLSDDELEEIGKRLFREKSVVKMISEGRER